MSLPAEAAAVPSPRPIRVRYSYFEHPGGVVTAIQRDWLPGDSARCRLCPPGRCVAKRDGCLIQIGMRVPPGELATFATHDLEWEGPALGLPVRLFDEVAPGDANGLRN